VKTRGRITSDELRGAIAQAPVWQSVWSPGFSRRRVPAGNGSEHFCGFTLLELLVATALLSFIILGLLMMFNQTQNAFRASMTQTDVLGSGRAATEMIARELEQLTPSYRGAAVNFYAAIPVSTPLTQGLPGSARERTNIVEDYFMLLRQNLTWIGIGYCVRTNDLNGGLYRAETQPGKMSAGTLYRFETRTTNAMENPLDLFTAFDFARRPGSAAISNRVCDGVLHFRFRAFNTNGAIITNFISFNQTNTAVLYPSPVASGEVGLYKFYSNAVPAGVELELGILEQRTWERFKAIAGPAPQRAYLSNHVGQVHVFRQRIPIRTVDSIAYQ